jgi:hypothetical protein
MWLPLEPALWLCAGVATLGGLLRLRAPDRRWHEVAFELSVVLGLYALWRFAGRLEVNLYPDDAFERGRQIWALSDGLPGINELTLNRQVAEVDWLARSANVFYAVAHAPAMIGLLIWLFLRHRDQYGQWRNTLALLTGLCLLVRLVPVAPPRLMPELGFIDTAIVHNQSVYGEFGTGVSAQLAAMPSIHVGWAVLIGWVGWQTSTSRWRWIAPAHAVVTSLAVVVTASHWWLDGIVAAAFIGPCWLVQHWCTQAIRSLRSRGSLKSPTE